MLVNAGRFSEAGARATKLVAEADALAYQPLIAELSLFQGEMEVYTEHHESAQQTLLRAVYAAEAGNAAKLAAKGWQLLALSQNQKGDAATAEQSIKHASSLVQGQGGDPEIEASIAHTLGGIQLQRKQYAEAANTFLHLADLYRKLEAADDRQIGTALANASAARGSAGDREGAIELSRQSLAVYQRTLDAHHPRVLMGNINLAVQLMYLGRLEEAAPLAESVRANADEKTQPFPRALGEEVGAEIALRQGRAAQGLPLAQAALTRFEVMRGRDNEQSPTSPSRSEASTISWAASDEAEEMFRRGVAIDHRRGDKRARRRSSPGSRRRCSEKETPRARWPRRARRWRWRTRPTTSRRKPARTSRWPRRWRSASRRRRSPSSSSRDRTSTTRSSPIATCARAPRSCRPRSPQRAPAV